MMNHRQNCNNSGTEKCAETKNPKNPENMYKLKKAPSPQEGPNC